MKGAVRLGLEWDFDPIFAIEEMRYKKNINSDTNLNNTWENDKYINKLSE